MGIIFENNLSITPISGVTLNVYVGGDYGQVCYGPPFSTEMSITTNNGATSLCDATVVYGNFSITGYFDNQDLVIRIPNTSITRIGILKNGQTEIQFHNPCVNYQC